MDILSDKFVINRKYHICNCCGRRFEKNEKMRVQVNTFEGSLNNFRSCETCYELTNDFRDYFIDDDGIFYGYCVNEALDKNQTPEELLIKLKQNKTNE